MKNSDVIQAWRKILGGSSPALSIEITKECPLRCPGCYAYEESHLHEAGPLRLLGDYEKADLVREVLALVEREKPLHVSIVGGEPLVRYRELNQILPLLAARGIHVRVVTSAVRPIPAQWAALPNFDVAVSIDGLQPEHDVRRSPATYERILKHIEGHHVTVHCTVTAQMMDSPGTLGESAMEQFLRFWSGQATVKRFWFSLFTPQIGDNPPEKLSRSQRTGFVEDLLRLRQHYPKLDMAESLIREFEHPPSSPDDCIFARTTKTVSADMKTVVTPCQLGGNPDCSNCGCIASMGLAAVGHHRLAGIIPVGGVFRASVAMGSASRAIRNA